MEHSFDTEHAIKYGLEEAIFIKNFTFWIHKNRANKRHFYEGRTWTYNSVSALSELFPYLSPKQIRRVMDSLRSQNVIMTGNFNDSKYDHTLWYAFVDESIFLNGNSDLPKWANHDAQTGITLTDNKPYSNTDNTNTKGLPKKNSPLGTMLALWIEAFPDYKNCLSPAEDNPALRDIGDKIFGKSVALVDDDTIKSEFGRFIEAVKKTWYADKPLKTIKNNFQEVLKAMKDPAYGKKPATKKLPATPFGF